MPTLRWVDIQPGLRLVAHGKADPDQAEWNAFAASVQVDSSKTYRIMVLSEGGTASLRQRRQWDQALQDAGGERNLTSVVTTSTDLRANLAAVTWLQGKSLRAFPPDQLNEALEHLQLDSSQMAELRRRIEEICAAMGLRLWGDPTGSTSS